MDDQQLRIAVASLPMSYEAVATALHIDASYLRRLRRGERRVTEALAATLNALVERYSDLNHPDPLVRRRARQEAKRAADRDDWKEVQDEVERKIVAIDAMYTHPKPR